MRPKHFAERAAWTIGIALLLIWLGFWFHGRAGRRSGIAEFESAKAQQSPRQDTASSAKGSEAQSLPTETPGDSAVERRRLPTDLPVDFGLWDQGRIEEYEESLEHDFGPPLAILRIPKIDLQVPLFEGTDDLVLNRGVGRIVGTARPGELGNLGIAGHRDGFFRGLKDVGPGDIVELETLTLTDVYRIDAITIVTPQDVHVLEHQAVPTLTLVTCYPFYYVGHAPKRYIVSATLVDSDSVVASNVKATSP